METMALKLSDYGNQRETYIEYAKKQEGAANRLQSVSEQLQHMQLSGKGELEMSFEGKCIIDYFQVGCCMIEIIQTQA